MLPEEDLSRAALTYPESFYKKIFVFIDYKNPKTNDLGDLEAFVISVFVFKDPKNSRRNGLEPFQ